MDVREFLTWIVMGALLLLTIHTDNQSAYENGRQAALAQVAAVADDIEHQKEFTTCLVERWRAAGVVP